MSEELVWPGDTLPPKRLTPEQRIHRLERIMDGVPNEDLVGLRTKVLEIEKIVKEYKDLKLMLRGALVFMALMSATNILSLYALAKNLGLVP